jgi:rsbT co-antagonist protein RsbR
MATIKSVQDLLRAKEKELLEAWMKAQLANLTLREDLKSKSELRKESIEFLRQFVKAVSTGNLDDIEAPEYEKIIVLLKEVSRGRAELGFTPSETATYIFSLKDSILDFLLKEFVGEARQLNDEVIRISKLLDKLGLITFEEYAYGRENLIKEQQKSILELSSPIVKLWDNILAVPIIGILDSRRTQAIMENLLNLIVQTESKIAIIDITGVAVMDTLVTTHLLKTVSAVKLLGAEAMVTGIRPEVAQTIVHLGIDLNEVETRSTMADGLKLAFEKLGLNTVKE